MTLLQTTHRLLKPLLRPSTVVGLDIGSRAIKLVAVDRSSSQPRVTTATKVLLTEHSIGDDRLLQQHLSDAVRDTSIPKHSPCIISLPSPMVDYQSQQWQGDPGASDEPAALAYNLVQELLGEEAELATFDFWWTQSNGSRRDIHLVWSMADLANRVTRCAQAVGLRPLMIDAPALALARTAKNENTNGRVLVIDSGGGDVNFVWTGDGSAEYVRNQIRFSSNTAWQELATVRGIDTNSANQILRDYGISCTSCQSIAGDNFQALQEWLEQLIFEVNRTRQFLSTRYGPSAVEQFLLCGGIAEIAGIAQWIESETGIKTQCAALPSNYRWTSAEAYTPAYAQAIALTLQGDLI